MSPSARPINHLDSVEREGDYRPASIEGFRLKNALLKAETLDAAVADFKAAEEREGDLRKVVLHCLTQPKVMDVQVITDNANAHVVLGLIDRQAGLQMPFCVADDNPIEPTLM